MQLDSSDCLVKRNGKFGINLRVESKEVGRGIESGHRSSRMRISVTRLAIQRMIRYGSDTGLTKRTIFTPKKFWAARSPLQSGAAAWYCCDMSSTLVLPPSTLEAQLLERHLLRMGSGQALEPPPITGDEIARILRGNLVHEFERLRGVPGFQLDPVPWETTRKLVEENTAESLGKLGRSPGGSVIYWKFKGKVSSFLQEVRSTAARHVLTHEAYHCRWLTICCL